MSATPNSQTPSSSPALSPPGGPDLFRRNLLAWFREHAKDYPWRRTRDPYAILVSEAMLQQTQIATVLGRGYYERWMRAFPDWKSLADASERELLKLWEGLGYYNRARNLQRAAAAVCGEFDGHLPPDPEAIRSLPGIGPYTAGALLSLAFGQRAALVDGNVSRVLARVFACGIPVNSPAGIRLAWERAEALVPESEPGAFNSALMELGQRICRPAAPACGECPVAASCLARERGETQRYPLKRPAPAATRRTETVLLARRQGLVWLEPETGPRRRGLWRLPEVAAETAQDWQELLRLDYSITRYRVELRVHEAPPSWRPAEPDAGGGWFEAAAPETWPPLGAPYRKALLRISSEAESPLRPRRPPFPGPP
jgi:A/G-specific adenine glycosylase